MNESVRAFTYYPSNRKYYCQRTKTLVSLAHVVKTMDLGFPVKVRDHVTKEDITRKLVRRLVDKGVIGRTQIEEFVDRLIDRIATKGSV
jgi:polyhydroxyalkanoate synthesis regulator protein